jgi:hypothetical protein
MNAICLIDTSVFVNLLNVPNLNQEKDKIEQEYRNYVDLNCTFILPMATIIETGNHIAQNGDGGTRRATAQRFCGAVSEAFNGNAPWQPSDFPNSTEILTWLHQFPMMAGQNKSATKLGEGTSFGDLSIIEEFKKCVKRFSMSEVFIWSLDADLSTYHVKP